MIPLLKDEHKHVLETQPTPSVGLHLNPERNYKETKKNLATCFFQYQLLEIFCCVI